MSTLILAFSGGLLSCVGISTVLIALGVQALESYVFAGLGGVTISCFIWIERSLTNQIKDKEQALGFEVARRLEAQNALYSRSLACCVRFDAGTLIIDRATPGFVKMLRMPTDSVVRGQRLEELLGVNPLKLESVVDSIKLGDSSVKQPKIGIKSADGLSMHALVSGHYFPEEHLIEAAFFVPQVNNAEGVADQELAQKDLDRFRKGMFRRETRILELKEEVNTVCDEAGLPKRYQTDKSSDDCKLESVAADVNNVGESEGGESE